MSKTSYNGNNLLRPSGVPIAFTAEQIQEWIRCRDDPIYFVTKYVRIVTLDNGLQPMNPYEFQKEIITKALTKRRLIVKTGRQAGKSTTCAVFLCHYIIFNDNKTCAILANKAATSREILSRVQNVYEYLPDWLKHGVTEWNKGSFQLENGSRILAAATSSSAIRGFSINCVAGDTLVTVMKNDGNIEELTIQELYENNSDITRFENISSGGGEFHHVSKIELTSLPKKISKYKIIYDKIIERAQNREIDENVYYEKHHIIPRSLGGTNLPENLVKLTLREHFLCHKLLVKITTGKERSSMLKALYMMSNTRGMMLPSRVFAECRKVIHDWAKSREWTQEQRQALSELKIKWWKENKEDILEMWETSGKNKSVSIGIKKYINENREEFDDRILKINTNPEKIRKTAEKHRGMKRSEEAKQKMKISANKRIQKNNGPHNKNKIQCYNPITKEVIQLSSVEEIPEGWLRGTGPQSKKRGHFYTDGISIKAFKSDDVIPPGWRKGRK